MPLSEPSELKAKPSRFKRVLVVEDESLLALMMLDQLVALGYAVVGPASTLSEALHMATTVSIDAALLDLNLHGVFAGEVAEILAQRHIPFLFITGYDRPPPGFFENVGFLNKPYMASDLQHAVERMLAKPLGAVV
jgi:CheY-like chemotaxis protein